MSGIGFFGGIDVVTSKFAQTLKWVQIKFPRSKKKRIRNKWAKMVNGKPRYPQYFKQVTEDAVFIIDTPKLSFDFGYGLPKQSGRKTLITTDSVLDAMKRQGLLR